MYLINTFLGFLIIQIADILGRDRDSEASPEKFTFWFFIKDTWQKILLSLALSVCISLVIRLNLSGVHALFSGEWTYGDLIYVLVGAVPEWVLQQVKKKFGITQPEKVKVKGEVFDRK